MKKTKIICTIGPATESLERLKNLVNTGMNIARLNFSHGDFEEHGNRIARIHQVNEELQSNIAILLDTKGPEIRCGDFENGSEEFEKGDIVRLVSDPILSTKEKIHIQCPEVFEDVQVGGIFLIDDGKMKLTILEKNPKELVCRIENPGVIKSRKGCNVPNVKLSMPFISPKDEADIRFGCKEKVNYIAASFTRRKEDILDIRKILAEEKCEDIQIIAKIENQEGYDNLDEILEVVDGVMVARGDLGVDVSFEKVPIYQKQIIKRCNAWGKPVITATHMLESMQANPRPTRAEASDVANAVLDGTDAIMLSGESAVGMYPIEAVQTMVTISEGTEAILPYREKLLASVATSDRTKEDAIGISVADTAMALDVAAIVVFTTSGLSARRISKFRPKCPIYAATFNERTRRGLAVNWGVSAFTIDEINERDNESELARHIAKHFGCKEGDTIIVVAGYPHGSGSTNSMRIIEVE
ncbi:MAG: pyruvate kinase [Breznakia sp.]